MIVLAVVAGTLGACGGSRGGTVDFYSSLPLSGASAARARAIVNGAKLALAQARGRAGQFTVRYVSLDDSTGQAGTWDPGRTAANARTAARDPKAVYYIGEYDSGASEISIPILNRAGVPQVSPANTYVGLTTSEPGSLPGEPTKYYPTHKRTYLRIVPRDTIQAAALVELMHSDGCAKVALANYGDTYGRGLARLSALEALGLGVTIVSDTGIDTTAANYRSYAQRIKAQGVDCFMFAGTTSRPAVKLVTDVNATIPTARIYGGDGICERAFTDPARHGIPARIAPLFKCTLPVYGLADDPGGKRFLSAYRAAYGDSHPDPYAIYGYEAMKLGLDTVAGLGSNGNDKAAVLAALFATNRNSVLGAYEFDPNGDTTLSDYGVYTVANGLPTFSSAIQ
ncbi:MAG TPA: branched-chain amino acid ABC transporter substrate-binding protein [Solirubrobacteraceae bacterium]|nr:branched-chain amino acid ABC transporter substrate-binding protein [Solirubrobacteraceae bacterium]